MSEKVKRKRTEKKLLMISGFIQAFCTHGLDGTHIRALAAAVGVSEALIYRYFESKDDIIRQCTVLYHEQVQKELVRIFEVYIYSPDEMAEKLLEYLDSVIDICRFLFQVMAHPIYCKMTEDTQRLTYSYILHASDLFQEKIGVPEEVATGAAFLITSMIDEYILKRSRSSFLIQFRTIERMVVEPGKSP